MFGSDALLWGEYTVARCSANKVAFSTSLFAQEPGVPVFDRIGETGIRGFFLDMIGLQMKLSFLLSEVTYAVKVVMLRSLSALRSEFAALVSERLSSGAWVCCHLALIFRFCATICFM